MGEPSKLEPSRGLQDTVMDAACLSIEGLTSEEKAALEEKLAEVRKKNAFESQMSRAFQPIVELLSGNDAEARSKILSWLAAKVAALEASEREGSADKIFEVFSQKVHH